MEPEIKDKKIKSAQNAYQSFFPIAFSQKGSYGFFLSETKNQFFEPFYIRGDLFPLLPTEDFGLCQVVDDSSCVAVTST